MQSSMQSRVSGWLWPALSLVLAIMVIVIAVQDFRLKRELNSIQDRITSVARAAMPDSGARAVPFDVYLPDGQQFTVRTDSLNAPLIMAWLSPNCDPCLDALDGWNSLADRFPGQFWGISKEPQYEFTSSDFAEHDVRFPIVTPVSDSVVSAYRVHATPLTLVIAQNGVIERVRPGPLSPAAVDSIISAMGQPYAERR